MRLALVARQTNGSLARRVQVEDLWRLFTYMHFDAAMAELLARLPSLLFPLSDEPFRRSDHAFDALICALVARAVQRGVTAPPQTVDQLRRATFEGWIHLPEGGPESLTQLAAVE